MKSVILKPKKEQALLNFHPWIFSGAIARKDQMQPGDVVLIKDHTQKPLAIGHWCHDEGLVCRVISFDPTAIINEDFFLSRVKQAHALRGALNFLKQQTTGFRLIHGEGDGLPGLVCDIFADKASIQCSNPGLAPYAHVLATFLQSALSIKHIWFVDSAARTTNVLLGESMQGEFLEHGLRFFLHMAEGQKTGHFLDQRENRLRVSQEALDRVVLDTFCYSGGFSTYALFGGAKHVTSVDISLDALKLCERNVALNNGAHRHQPIKADCFQYLREIKRDEFDMIILDPPAFAKSAQAVTRAARGYKDINLLALKAIRSSGLIFTFSCSQHISTDLFKKIIFAAAKDSARAVKIIGEMTQGADHPVSVFCPQSAYLKGLILYVE